MITFPFGQRALSLYAHVCGFWGNPPHLGRYRRGTVLCWTWFRSTSARHQVDPSSRRLLAVSVHFSCVLLWSWHADSMPADGTGTGYWRFRITIPSDFFQFSIDMIIQKPVCFLPSIVHQHHPEVSIRPNSTCSVLDTRRCNQFMES